MAWLMSTTTGHICRPSPSSTLAWSDSRHPAKKRAEPYTKIVQELPEMQRDTVALVKRAVAEQRRVYVLVNNRSEGNAPLTVQVLSDSVRMK